MSRSWLLPVVSLLVVLAALGAISQAIYSTWHARRILAGEVACRTAMKLRGWEELQRSAEQLLVLDRENALAQLCLAEAAQRRGDFEAIASHLAKIRDDDPKCLAALQELLELQLAKLERPLDALATAERILRIDPRHAVAHQRLVFIYAMTLQRQRMVEQIRKAADVRCLSGDMLVYLANSVNMRFSDGALMNHKWLRSSGGSELFEVAYAVQLAVTSVSNSESLLSETNHRPGDDSPVEECLQKYPSNLEVLAFFLDKECENGNADQVLKLMDAAPDSAEYDSRFWRAKGWLHNHRHELEAAEEAYHQALRVNPYDWRSRYQYSTVLRRRGKSAEAEPESKRALVGKMLERELFELPTASDMPPPLGLRLLKYMDDLGDQQLATAVRAQMPWSRPHPLSNSP